MHHCTLAWAIEQDPVFKKAEEQAQWLMPVIPATQEAEAGELLEPGWGRGCSEPRSRHCTPAWVTRAKLHLKKKKKKKSRPSIGRIKNLHHVTLH